MKGLKLVDLVSTHPAISSIPQPRIIPTLKVAYKSGISPAPLELDSQEKREFVAAEFVPFFQTMQKMYRMVCKEQEQLEEKEGYMSARSLGQSLEALEKILPYTSKDADNYMKYALAKMPDDLIDVIYNEICILSSKDLN
jgi:hypothetical protein